jgi:uncharacterized membrane protein YfhO
MSVDSASWPEAYFTPSENAKILHTCHSSGDTVVITRASENEIDMAANNRESAYLVLTDTYYPGWEATIDGVNAPILRCNYAMRAIALPPGEHRVSFAFRPASFRKGAWISLFSLLLLLGLCCKKGKSLKHRTDWPFPSFRTNIFIA